MALIGVTVDDFLITTNKPRLIESIFATLNHKYALKRLTAHGNISDGASHTAHTEVSSYHNRSSCEP